MPGENRGDDGRFKAEHEKEPGDLLDAMEPMEPYTTGEIARQVDIPRRTAYHYLEQLRELDRIVKKKPEPRLAIWILPD